MCVTVHTATVAMFYLSGLPSGDADAVELDPAALPVCREAHKGEQRLFRGMETESPRRSMVLQFCLSYRKQFHYVLLRCTYVVFRGKKPKCFLCRI